MASLLHVASQGGKVLSHTFVRCRKKKKKKTVASLVFDGICCVDTKLRMMFRVFLLPLSFLFSSIEKGSLVLGERKKRERE